MQTETRNLYETVVRDAVGQIQGRLNDPPSFRELADRACLSPYHFHRIFRALVGESPAELIRRLRMERAAIHLRDTRLPVSEIALDAGFSTHESFTKAFLSEFRVPPSAYREGRRTDTTLKAYCGVHYAEGNIASGPIVGGFTEFQPRRLEGIEMKLEKVVMPAQRLACVRHVGPYQEMPTAYSRFFPIAMSLGLLGQPELYVLSVFYDAPDLVPAEELRSDAAVMVTEDAAIGDLDERRLSGGAYLRAEYQGPYTGLTEAWETLFGKYVPESGHRLRDAEAFEVYVDDPQRTLPEKLRTNLYVPIAD